MLIPKKTILGIPGGARIGVTLPDATPGLPEAGEWFSAGGSVQTPSDCGMFHVALNVASVLPDASGAGYVSIPWPVVTCFGAPPEVGTAQMWRRSISPALVQ